MKICRGNEKSLEAVTDLWVEMVKESRPDWKPSKEVWMAMAGSMLMGDTYMQLLAIEKERIVGFLDFMLFTEPSTGKLHCVGQHLYVKPEYRGSSAGSRIYREWTRICKASKVQVMELFSFEDEIDRWDKVGFMPVRVLMRKELNYV